MRLIIRPVVVGCIFFVLGLLAGYYIVERMDILLIVASCISVLLLLTFSICLIKRMKLAARTVFVLLLCFFCFVAAFLISRDYYVGRVRIINEFYNNEVDITGSVTELRSRTSYSSSYKVRVCSINGNATDLLFLLDCEGQTLRRGERFSCRAVLCPFSEMSAGFPEKAVYRSQGMRARLVLCEDSLECLGMEAPSLFFVFADMRDGTVSRFASYLSDRGAALFSGAFAGDRSYISDSDSLSVLRSGASHLLAVSGMHLSVVVGVLWFFLSKMGVGVRVRSLSVVLLALIYALFTGFSPSAVRSLIMLSFTYIGASLGKEGDGLTSLSVAVMLMLSISPNLLFSASLWLSVSATLGILLVSPVINELMPHRHRSMISDVLRDDAYTLPLRMVLFIYRTLREWLRMIPVTLLSSVICGVGACVFSVPFSLAFFGNVSYAAIPCGILLSFVITLTLTLGPVVLVFCHIPFVADAASLLGEAFFTITQFFSSIDGVYINAKYASVYCVIFLFASAVLICSVRCDSKKPVLYLCICCYVLTFVCSEISERVEYSSAGIVYTEGDCLMLRGDEGLCAVDMGGGSISALRRSLSQSDILRENDISAFVFTQISSKHEQLVQYLVTNYHVDTLYFPHSPSDDVSERLLAAEKTAEEYSVSVSYYSYGQKLLADGVRVEVSVPVYLRRSIRPIYYISVDKDGTSALWLSSAFFEGGRTGGIYDRYYDCVILGSSGPVPRRKWPSGLLRIHCGNYIASNTETLEKSLYKSVESDLLSCCSDNTWYIVAQ